MKNKKKLPVKRSQQLQQNKNIMMNTCHLKMTTLSRFACCVIASTLSNEATVPSKLKLHFKNNHPEYVNKTENLS
jgi:hypothetical protein